MQKWIDEIESQIIDTEDKVLFDEAIGCLKNNFLRSSYIITWICLVESLKRKLYKLSNLGDKKAEEAIKKIEKNEEQNNSVDKIIMEESMNCSIIENTDYSTLKYLWEQRCIFAHPYRIQPQIEEVKHILSQTLKLSLGKDLFFNKDYLTEIAINIVDKPFFLPVDNEKLQEYSQKVLSRTPQNLFPFFFKTLLYKIGTIKDNDTKLNEQVKLRQFIIQTLENTEKQLDDAVWAIEDRAVKFPYECFIGFVSKSIWTKIPERVKEILISYIETEENPQKLSVMKLITKGLIESSILEDKFKTKFIKYLNKNKFANAINYYGDSKSAYERVISELETFDYNMQNDVVDFLKTDNGVNHINGLDFQKQFYLGRILKAASRNNHFKSQSLTHSIISLSTNYSGYVIGGIAFGHIINNRDLLNIELKQIVPMVKILNNTEQDIQEYVYQKIFKNLNDKKADEFDKFSYSNELLQASVTDKMVAEITDWKGVNKDNCVLLVDKIKSYFA
ncbi:MAG: hypothetical protein K8R37_10855 [Bacteroidales bacterium]|nr:hypothetical protein [Bacteroidales bacterium]